MQQGSVLSAQLFNFFVHNFPDHAQCNQLFADDFGLIKTLSDIHSLGDTLTGHLHHILEWSEANKLVIAPEK
jgi:hypothetical protein